MVLLRVVALNAIDDAWEDHLRTMDSLRNTANLMHLGNADPLQEYTILGNRCFDVLLSQMRRNLVGAVYSTLLGTSTAQKAEAQQAEESAEWDFVGAIDFDD
eukprot:CAMPEP_0118941658 /NCGR_PEP_ID=MMETSP1169-20130426/34380_1 /TAXON_ID=36882 /ORGANISM="Pyramimonas obovata, Strain CCMP722" /LENGTH=101 /DNA_ID=CAMNT_0006886473 /DNA_START=1 /DNA_END=303 /DNA_ORIENTATION=+